MIRRILENAVVTPILMALGLGGFLMVALIIGGITWLLLNRDPADTAREAQEADPADLPEGTLALPTPAPVSGDYPAPAGKIVYTCFDGASDNLCLINADGSDQRLVTTSEFTDWYAALSPDGLSISFSTRRDGAFQLYLSDSSGGDLRRLYDLADSYAPEISPDGTQIVFVTMLNGKQDIYLMGLDGQGVRQLTTHPADDFDPTWSPDGTQIAFTSNRSGTSELHIINADGSGERQVTSGSDQQDGGRVDWSPDGGMLAFYAGERGQKDIFTVPADCTRCGQDRITRLTNGGNNKAPAYSPDGAWIAFASNIEGDNEIFIMRADGSEWRQLTFNELADWQPRWGS
jgi:Tol biopolymer transport system component